MSRKPAHSPLRKGWTTGACATAGARAAYGALLGAEIKETIEIVLPGQKRVSFELHQLTVDGTTARASVIKDAGDDPDITHGAEIVVTVSLTPDKPGVAFKNGPGVGRVTKPGLPLAVGEPAINPAPRQMIVENLQEVSTQFGAPLGVQVDISIPGGEKLAEKTMNPRLGIIGGLSILGTTGIVVPYSCASWIHAIHRGIDVARAEGLMQLAASTGSTSEKTVKAQYDLPETALIDMGDFIGAVLKYLNKAPIEKLIICGGFAKMCKFAQGEMDLHSSRSKVDFEKLVTWLTESGAGPKDSARAKQANTALEVLELSQALSVPLGDLVAKRAREVALATVSSPIQIEVILVNRSGKVVGHA